MNVLASGMGVMKGSSAASSFGDLFLNIRNWFYLFPFKDIGVGTYNGGFGLVFWCLGFSSWIYVFTNSILNIRKKEFTKFLFLIQLPIGLIILLFTPAEQIQFAGRFSIYVIAIGLFSFISILDILKINIYVNTIKTICVLFSILTLSILNVSTRPSYSLEIKQDNKLPYEYNFIMNTEPEFLKLKHIWYPLDYLTIENKTGINCYIASNKTYYMLSPFYGSNLQIRPIYYGSDVPQKIPAYVFMYSSPKTNSMGIINNDIYYPKSIITIEKVLALRTYAVITKTDLGILVINKDYLKNNMNIEKLRTYYAKNWPNEIIEAKKLSNYLDSETPVLTSNTIAYGLRYLDGKGGLDRILIMPSGYEEHVARSQKITKFYTLGEPLEGYKSEKIATIKINQYIVEIYINHEL